MQNKCKLPDNLDATSVNTVMYSRCSIPSMFVKSIKNLPCDFSVVYNIPSEAMIFPVMSAIFAIA